MTFRQILQHRAKKQLDVKALKSLTPHDVLLSPIITEKTYKQQETANVYAFKVHGDANKNDVKKAITYLYKVSPLSVRLVCVPYKGRSQRKLVRRAYKKAIITLDKKDKIEVGV
jgi:large subunit ribosomal protein L23